MLVTVDTCALPIHPLKEAAAPLSFQFQVVTVTLREAALRSKYRNLRNAVPVAPENAVWGQTPWGTGLWTSKKHSQLERILEIIAAGSFPKKRDRLSHGHRNQLRDAMIFETHIRSGGKIFVTADATAFIQNGRRCAFESTFSTRVMTPREFIAFCA